MTIISLTGTGQTSIKGRHLTPTSVEWLHLDGADVIMGVHSWSSLPVLGQVISYNGPLPAPKLVIAASTMIEC